MKIMIAIASVLLAGCVTTQVPPPTVSAADGSFQARLHRTSGAAESGLQGGTGRLSGGTAEQGAADGCTLTVLGPVPADVEFRLKAGDCEASAPRSAD